MPEKHNIQSCSSAILKFLPFGRLSSHVIYGGNVEVVLLQVLEVPIFQCGNDFFMARGKISVFVYSVQEQTYVWHNFHSNLIIGAPHKEPESKALEKPG